MITNTPSRSLTSQNPFNLWAQTDDGHCIQNGPPGAQCIKHYYPNWWIEGQVEVQLCAAHEYYMSLFYFIWVFRVINHFPGRRNGAQLNPWIRIP